MRITNALFALAAAAAITSGPAAAQSASLNVRYSDLDLSTADGQAKLESRIDQAARKTCGMDERHVGSRIASRDARDCYAQTKQQVHERVTAMIARGNGRG
jgi:UrcA family protein